MSKDTGDPPSRIASDVVSGFLVFLIALPLCLAIAMASGFPPAAGVLTAVVGGLLGPFLGSAPLTIKGPAAGLIVIAVGAVTELGEGDLPAGYRRALAVGVVAAVFQILFAAFKLARYGAMVPPAVVHGMLAAIGVTIMAKESYKMLGVTPSPSSPLLLLAELPAALARSNPRILLIGIVALVILFGWPSIRSARIRKVPAPLVALVATVPLGLAFGLGHSSAYELFGRVYEVGPSFLLSLPDDLTRVVTFPDFSAVTSGVSIKYIVMFTLVGSIESVLSQQAVDSMDPNKRAADADRDLLSVGVGNLVASALGGLPMISEIVRSKANVDAGARTAWSNFFHAAFLLALVTVVPSLLRTIPLATLAAMLVYTGARLASPKELLHARAIGRDQLLLFVTTLAVTLGTNLLAGIAAGIALKLLLHAYRAGSFVALLRTRVTSRREDETLTVAVEGPATFLSLPRVRAPLAAVDATTKRVLLDLGGAELVDHTFLERFHAMALEWENAELVVVGTERLERASDHPTSSGRLATGRSSPPPEDRIAPISAEELREVLADVAHLLPTQAPLARFIHHNTLHAFEHLPFEEAVVEAAEVFGAEPFPAEKQLLAYFREGCFEPRHVEIALREEGVDDEPIFPGGPGRRTLRALRLSNPAPLAEGALVRFLASETSLLRTLQPGAKEDVFPKAPRALEQALTELFRRAEEVALHVPLARAPAPSPRLRDLLATDPDEIVNPIVGRALAAYLDQGVAHFEMPERSRGFYRAFRARHLASPAPDRFGGALRRAMQRAHALDLDAEQLVLEELALLELEQSQLPRFLERTLLALPGWSGLLGRLAERPDLAPVEAPAVDLMELLAVRLVLDRLAAESIAGEPIALALRRHAARAPAFAPRDLPTFALELFLFAQLAGVTASRLGGDVADSLAREVRALDGVARRRVYQRALEAAFLEDTARALSAHLRDGPAPTPTSPDAQVVFCIDDREESFRRHLEEAGPAIETFAYAGFYDVAMWHLGYGKTRHEPLCPMPVTPRRRVVERPLDPGAASAAGGGRVLARLFESATIGSRTLARGAAFSLAGHIGAAPVAFRTLFPRAASRLAAAGRALASRPPTTEIVFAHHEQEHPDGFTVPEMVEAVGSVLRQMGLVDRFAPLVVVTGHGSTSVNNPYTAAYNCGACAGHRGGPNGRTFAAMANLPEVRGGLAELGIAIPSSTHFVGAYHDTGSDEFTFFDSEKVPSTHRDRFSELRRIVDVARARNAHERCRRFEHIGLDASPCRALAHAEARVADLGQPRPELGHANNALYVIGRRALTRGLFLDRRAFLSSYDPTIDPDGQVLRQVIAGGLPVCAGISLEYWFSVVDPVKYGCGTKLPQNVSGLLGVMDGHGGDLRTGLPTQMVELHEPLRLACIVEARNDVLLDALRAVPGAHRLVANRWVHLYAIDPSSHELFRYVDGRLEPADISIEAIATARTSADWYRGKRERLPFARIHEDEAQGNEVRA